MSSKLGKDSEPSSYQALLAKNRTLEAEVQDLKTRLEEAEELKRAISEGDLDALVISRPQGELIFTLDSADRAYRMLVETMNEGTVTLACDGTILYCNRHFAELVKRPPQVVVGTSIYEFIAPEDIIIFKALLQQETGKGEIKLLCESCMRVPAYLSVSSLKTEGSPNAWCLVATDLTEQKKNEEIVAAERLARSIIEQAAEAIVVCDTSGKIIRFSNAVSRICECNPIFKRFEEIIDIRYSEGKNAGKSVFPVSSALKGFEILGVETVLELKGCRKFYLQLNSGPLRNADQKIIGCVVTLTDITERKQAEEAMSYASEQRRLALEIAQLGTWEYDVASGLTRLDQRCGEIFGLDREQAHTLEKLMAVVHPCDRQRISEEISAALDPEGPGIYNTEYRIRREDGIERFVAVRGRALWRDRKREPVRLLGTLMDITENKKMEEELQESECQQRELARSIEVERSRLAAVLENLPVGVWITDMNGNIIGTNKAADDIWAGNVPLVKEVKDYSQYTAWYVDSGKLLASEEYPVARALLTGKSVQPVELNIRRFDGTGGTVLVSASPIKDRQDRLTGAVGINLDITERKRAENALYQAYEEIREQSEKLKDQAKKLREANEALSQSEKRFRLLSEANSILLLSKEPENVIQNIAEKMMRHLNCDVFFNYVFDETRDRLYLNACGGISEDVAKEIKWLDKEWAICGCVARDGCRIISKDVQNNGDTRANLVRSMGVQAYSCQPLRIGETTIGTLSFGTRSRKNFTEEELALMSTVADQVSVAIERRRSEDAIRESRAQLEAELADTKLLQSISAELLHEDNTQALYEKIIDAAMQIMHSEYASIQMFYPESKNGGELKLLAFHGFNHEAAKFWKSVNADSSSSCGNSLRTGKRVIVPDVENCDFMTGSEDQIIYLQASIRAVQTTPLLSRKGELVGMISTHWSNPHEPSKRDLRLLDILARQAADLIDHKQAEIALRESEEKYRNIIETANEGIWIVDSGSRISYVNRKMAEMLGYGQEEIIGKSAWSFTDEEGKNIGRQNMEKRKRSIDGNQELKLLRKNGSPLWTIVNAKSLFDKNGKFTGSMKMLTDITERKEAEARLKETLDNLEDLVKERTSELEKAYSSLKESERGLAEAQKMAHLGSWYRSFITDKVQWSDETYRIFGFEPQEFEVTFDSFLSHVHPEDRKYVYSNIKKALNHEPYSSEYRIVSANGVERVVHTQGELVIDERKVPTGMKGTIQDITEHKMAEEALEKIDKIRIKEIHHRIKNNLQVISSLLSLEAEKFSDQKMLEAFRESQNRVTSMALIHEELYRGDKSDELDFAAYLRKFTADLFSSYSLGNNISLKIDLEQVHVDMDTAIPLGIIVNELVSNSLKHAFPDRSEGEICISLQKTETFAVKSKIFGQDFKEVNGFQYILRVTDNGKGIPEEIEFQRADSLGLQLVNILVEQIDGCIDLKRNCGTEFAIWFGNRAQKAL